MNGFIDIYWLHDDGGLTLLLPTIIKTRKKLAKCQVTIATIQSMNQDRFRATQNISAVRNGLAFL
jgi:solute carrier family 12 sodium/potassium/chloride transporter 2